MPNYLLRITIILSFLLLSIISANADITVGKAGQFQNIQMAINQAPPNSVIQIEPGTYHENIEINKPLTIIGNENDNSCVLVRTVPQSPAMTIKSNDVIVRNIRFMNSNPSSIGIGVFLDGVKNCKLKNNWVGYLGPFLKPFVIGNEASLNEIDSNYIQGSAHTCGFSIEAAKMNNISYNVMDYGWELFAFTNCDTVDNTLIANTLLSKNMSGRLKDDSTTNAYSLRINIHDSLGNRIEKVINPSGWEGQGKFLYRQIWNFCSHTSNSMVSRYWEVDCGGSNHSMYSVVKNQDSLNAVWSKFRLAPEKPTIDFNKFWLILIQPGQTNTQYNYKISILEERKTIKFYVQEYHTEKAQGLLASQEAIFAYELPISKKKITVKIERCSGSEGPYPL